MNSLVANPWKEWGEYISQHLNEGGFAILPQELTVPISSEFGDMAVPFFRLAKERGQSPATLAQAAAELLSPFVESAVPAGPYLNIRLFPGFLTDAVNAITDAEHAQEGVYGTHPSRNQEPLLFEYANPNTHKEIHIGHLRNFVTGVAYQSLWKAAGIPVQTVQFVNDQGANVAKALWALVKKAQHEVLTLNEEQVEHLLARWPIEMQTGNALADLYVASTQALEGNEAGLAEVSFIQSQLEAHDPAWERLWRVTRDWCLRELHEICSEMGIVFDRHEPYLESSFLDEAANIVARLEANGVAKQSAGALIIDLETEKLGVCLIRKSDGNLLYLSKDLALAEQKKQDYPTIQASVVLTDDRQSLHFKQLQAILQKMGYGRPYLHLGYGLLTLKEGAMSSRKGNIITYQWLRDELIQQAFKQIDERHAEDSTWTSARKQETARAIAFGGMKFALLKQDPGSVFLFDREQALAFEGMTGPYCQYAVVRLRTILEKAGALPVELLNPSIGTWQPSERALILALAMLPTMIERAAGLVQDHHDIQKTQPAVLAQWCFSTAQAINAFYRDVPVLDAPEPARTQRLQLAQAAVGALTNGLAALTIDVPHAM